MIKELQRLMLPMNIHFVKYLVILYYLTRIVVYMYLFSLYPCMTAQNSEPIEMITTKLWTDMYFSRRRFVKDMPFL